MSTDVRIVPSEERHLPSFRQALDAVAREGRYLVLLEAPPLTAIQQFLLDIVTNGGAQVLALEAGDRVVGWCDIARHPRDGYRHVGTLGMGLIPSHRGRGIGARLAQAAIDRARQNGIARIELEVLGSNAPARSLYRRLGFVEEGVKRRSRFIDGVYDDNVLMALI